MDGWRSVIGVLSKALETLEAVVKVSLLAPTHVICMMPALNQEHLFVAGFFTCGLLVQSNPEIACLWTRSCIEGSGDKLQIFIMEILGQAEIKGGHQLFLCLIFQMLPELT